jgi:dolichol-phosphate mannosyltransferase
MAPDLFAARIASRGPAVRAPEFSVVIPVFDEEYVLIPLYRRLVAVLDRMAVAYEIVFVNDGSRDATPVLLDRMAAVNPRVVVVHLSRNFGHQPAVSAGLDAARGSAVAVLDGDLQDPPEVLPALVEKWRAGAEVVYAVRTRRKEGPLKRLGYFAFYRLLRAVGDLPIPLDAGDFCLMDRKVVEVLRHLPERVRFVRGLRTFVGFRQVGVEYERAARAAGKPKYTLRKLAALAADGLVDFSSYPLRVVTYLGLAAVLLAALLGGWAVLDAVTNNSTPRGWASLLVVVLFMGAIQLISLGVVGEYVRRIFLEVKGRPTYIVRDVVRTTPAESRAA